MGNTPDLSNAAYTADYLAHRNSMINTAFQPENKIKTEESMGNGCKRVIEEYKSEQNGEYVYCARNIVFDESGAQIHEYMNIYHHPFFCDLIKHVNGKSYLFYKEDLYGYGVYDLEEKKAFSYFPTHSWHRGETFIATNLYYNEKNNIMAAEGCYWACPSETFLFRINDPLKIFDSHLSLHLLLDKEYDKYDDICFSGWEGTGLELKCYDIQAKPPKNIDIVLKEEDYLPFL